ncbi:hypothetical protein C900_04156 [Fulvivirga imtechensis AK7]|uniref:Uncharacterized protein n=1 Tax=Fulvivirga imtechensis AK7 TaxID=1237149 RepID=L8K047_9BACT|nr:hypothetical protein [Fulvivirga imtechensis]ELR73304.1 hypothetical protein C900_04156 [Fulvivirga imtechensis AK7]
MIFQKNIYEILGSVLLRRTKKIFVNELNDLDGMEIISGQVMDLTHRTSFKSKFKIDLKNHIQVALAGPLLKNDYAELTVREKPDRRNNCRQFKVYAKETYLKRNPLKKGDFILANIKEVEHGLKLSKRVWEVVLHKVF